MVGKSAPMRSLFQLIETVAPTATTILITGETGTGKEMVARAIHQTSPRHRGRFVAINVSAIPETLLDAELFGHAKGAFTGAVAMRQGRLEQADGGTLFLDEVGTMPMALQMKMLRVLQEREFERIGDTRTIKVDVRIVAATNADLAKMVKEGSFREDLYYRLNVIPVHLAAAARARRRHSAAGPALHREIPRPSSTDAISQAQPSVSPRSDATADVLRVAGTSVSWRTPIERALAMIGSRTQIEVTDLPADLQSTTEDKAQADARSPCGRPRSSGARHADREGHDRPRPGAHGSEQRRRRAPARPEAHDPRRETQALLAPTCPLDCRS